MDFLLNSLHANCEIMFSEISKRYEKGLFCAGALETILLTGYRTKASSVASFWSDYIRWNLRDFCRSLPQWLGYEAFVDTCKQLPDAGWGGCGWAGGGQTLDTHSSYVALNFAENDQNGIRTRKLRAHLRDALNHSAMFPHIVNYHTKTY